MLYFLTNMIYLLISISNFFQVVDSRRRRSMSEDDDEDEEVRNSSYTNKEALIDCEKTSPLDLITSISLSLRLFHPVSVCLSLSLSVTASFSLCLSLSLPHSFSLSLSLTDFAFICFISGGIRRIPRRT